MPIEFSCPSCRQLVRTPDATAGKKGKCPQCRAVVQIPAAPVPAKGPRRPAPPAQRPAHAVHQPPAPPAAIEFFCVECGQLVRTPAAAAGKKGKCPNCRAVIEIPKKGKSGLGSQGPGVRKQETADRGQQRIEDEDLVELLELTPLDGGLEPLVPDPLASYAPPAASRGNAPFEPLPPQLPLIDEVLPTIPSAPPPASAGGLPSGSPFATGSRPRRVLTDLGRSGLPWERDPSLDTFIETVRYVITSPADAFDTMHRFGGIGSPLGYLILSSVLTSFVGVAFGFVAGLLQMLVFWALSESKQPLVIHWDRLFLFFGGATCAAVSAAFVRGTIGGFITAALYHVSLMICGAARGGFEATYRVIAFGGGSVYILLPVPLIGLQLAGMVIEPIWKLLILAVPLALLLFIVAMHFIVLTYGFSSAHATSGPRAFAAMLVALLLYVMFVVVCIVAVLVLIPALGARFPHLH